IRVKQKQLNLGVGIKQMIFNIDSAMKHSYSNDDTYFSIDVTDEILEEDFNALLDEGSKILLSIEATLLEEEIFSKFDKFMAMTVDKNSKSESDTGEPPFEKITINTDYKIKRSLEEPLTDLKLKPLPDSLEYVFLEEPYFLPIVTWVSELTFIVGSELDPASYRLFEDKILATYEHELCVFGFLLASCQVSSNELRAATYRPRTYDDLNNNEKKRFNADVCATNIMLQGLPKDIYKLINHNIKAKAIWDYIKMLLAGSELTKEDKESQLYDEFKCFKMLPGENINEYYNVQGRQNQNQRNFARGYSATGNGGAQVRAGNVNTAEASAESDYFKDKILLMHAQENGVVLDEKELLFLTGEQTKKLDADVDDHLYLSVNDVYIVPSYATSILNDAYVLHDNVAYVLHDPLVTELNIYKEQVAIYEQRARTSPAYSVPEKKVKDHHRKNKSKLSKKNRVDLSTSIRCTVLDTNSNSLCETAVATACYTQNRSLIHTLHNKTSYELGHDKKPNLSFLLVFGALCYPTKDSEDLGKLKAKSDIGLFVGYVTNRKGYRIYNKRTRQIMETIHVSFDELTGKTVPVQTNASSEGHSPSSSDHQSSSVHYGVAADHSFEVNPFSPADNEPFVNIFAPNPSSEVSSSREILIAKSNQSTQPHEHI
nr:integrase, catalytic region, zinc finger, CCHC-type, peptidase aspartic, catalytic [Tanacetum cinerariifolium]